MTLQQRLRRGLLIVLKYTLNPLTRRLARSSFGPFAFVRHVGRRSGKRYETPIIVAPIKDGFAIELTYGPDVDWHKNVVAAGGCTIIWHGKEFVIDKIEPLDTETGRSAFSPAQQLILRLLRREHFERFSLN
jgi:deazaflavin-dependent oxidoreductase (nitroreductase family)